MTFQYLIFFSCFYFCFISHGLDWLQTYYVGKYALELLLLLPPTCLRGWHYKHVILYPAFFFKKKSLSLGGVSVPYYTLRCQCLSPTAQHVCQCYSEFGIEQLL